MQQMMKQAQELQRKMQTLQKDLEAMEVAGSAGGDSVKALLNGKGDVKSITINDAGLLSAENKEILEDLIVAAIHNAKDNCDAQVSKKMDELGIPKNLPI